MASMIHHHRTAIAEGRNPRSAPARREFIREHPCPATGKDQTHARGPVTGPPRPGGRSWAAAWRASSACTSGVMSTVIVMEAPSVLHGTAEPNIKRLPVILKE